MITACATVPAADLEDRTLAYACDDIVVVGRIKNGEYQHVEIQDDIIGHGWIDGKIEVRMVVKGKGIPSSIPVRYFAHTYMRDDRDFMFVLKHSGNEYEVRTAQLMSVRPRLASQCE